MLLNVPTTFNISITLILHSRYQYLKKSAGLLVLRTKDFSVTPLGSVNTYQDQVPVATSKGHDILKEQLRSLRVSSPYTTCFGYVRLIRLAVLSPRISIFWPRWQSVGPAVSI